MGNEYRPLATILHNLGIHFRHRCPHIHEQNDKAICKPCHITEIGLCLLAQAKLPLNFWWEAFEGSVFLINRLPTPVLKHKSPLFMFKQKPDYRFLCVFQCNCFPHTRPYSLNKYNFHTEKCLFLGYSEIHKGYKCLSPSRKLYTTRHFTFHKKEFP